MKRQNTDIMILVSLTLILGLMGTAISDDDGSRAIIARSNQDLEPDDQDFLPVHPCPDFYVRISVDRKDRTYEVGERVLVSACSEREGYLYVIDELPDGTRYCLYPNEFQQDNRIVAQEEVVIPSPEHNFHLEVAEADGEETIYAYVIPERIDPEQLGVKSLTDQPVTEIDSEAFAKRIAAVADDEKRRDEWSEHRITVTTVEANSRSMTRRNPRRYVAIVSVPTYQDQTIDPLPACDNDYQIFQEAMRQHGRIDEFFILVGEDATLVGVVDMFTTIADQMQPCDELILLWTGHGGVISDKNGDESDGFDEYLVPYDGDQDDPFNTMLIDDALGRLLQQFVGCKVTIICDCCHSGGVSDSTKSISRPDRPAFDMLDSEVNRIKDIEGNQAALLCSCDSPQVSYTDFDGSTSVMTRFLVELIENAEGALTLEEAYEEIRDLVPEYVEETFPGCEQTPILVNEIGTVYLKPAD